MPGRPAPRATPFLPTPPARSVRNASAKYLLPLVAAHSVPAWFLQRSRQEALRAFRHRGHTYSFAPSVVEFAKSMAENSHLLWLKFTAYPSGQPVLYCKSLRMQLLSCPVHWHRSCLILILKDQPHLMLKRSLVVCLLFVICLPALAKPKKKLYANGATDLFNAALRTARERHVVTYVDEKMLMFTFQTGRSVFSKGFVANASIEPQDDHRATLVINVQTKDGEVAFGAGDRMTDKFFDQVKEELAGQVTQKSSVKAEQANIEVAPPKAVPSEPTMTAPANAGVGTVILSATPENAEVTVDGNFVGNAPVNLKLAQGKHTIVVTARGYQALTREITVMSDSEVRLTAQLER